MRIVDILSLLCFVASAVFAAINMSTTGMYVFAVGVALAVLRSYAAEMDKKRAQQDSPDT